MLGNIIRRPGSTENNIVRRQTAMYKQNQKSWINQAKSILSKYELPSIYELLETKPKKTTMEKTSKESNIRTLDQHTKEPSKIHEISILFKFRSMQPL